MAKKIFDVKKFSPRREKREFQKGEKGIVLCKLCGDVYHKKAWRHNLKNHGKILEKFPFKKTICPACLMIQNNQFEVEIIIENIPKEIKNELVNLIKAFGERAYAKNSQHRIISIKPASLNPRLSRAEKTSSNPTLEITTTENQMALQLAKKIKSTFKKDGIKFSYSPRPSDVVYIKLIF